MTIKSAPCAPALPRISGPFSSSLMGKADGMMSEFLVGSTRIQLPEQFTEPARICIHWNCTSHLKKIILRPEDLQLTNIKKDQKTNKKTPENQQQQKQTNKEQTKTKPKQKNLPKIKFQCLQIAFSK